MFPRSRAYGTAMTLLALRMQELPEPSGYSAAKWALNRASP